MRPHFWGIGGWKILCRILPGMGTERLSGLRGAAPAERLRRFRPCGAPSGALRLRAERGLCWMEPAGSPMLLPAGRMGRRREFIGRAGRCGANGTLSVRQGLWTAMGLKPLRLCPEGWSRTSSILRWKCLRTVFWEDGNPPGNSPPWRRMRGGARMVWRTPRRREGLCLRLFRLGNAAGRRRRVALAVPRGPETTRGRRNRRMGACLPECGPLPAGRMVLW